MGVIQIVFESKGELFKRDPRTRGCFR